MSAVAGFVVVSTSHADDGNAGTARRGERSWMKHALTGGRPDRVDVGGKAHAKPEGNDALHYEAASKRVQRKQRTEFEHNHSRFVQTEKQLGLLFHLLPLRLHRR